MQPETIIGQEKALALLAQWRKRIGIAPHFRGVQDLIVLAGPPACGKRMAAESTARELGRALLHLHMGEFAFADDITRLLGPNGLLCAWIAEHPDGCVLFEDIDEADHSIQRAVSAIVADGAAGRPTLFSGAIFLFVFRVKEPDWIDKNVLDRYYAQPLLQQARFYEALSKAGAPDSSGTVRQRFDAELLNVLSESDLLLFYPLEIETLRTITQQLLARTLEQLRSRSGRRIEAHHGDALSLALMLSCSPYLNSKRIAHKLPAQIIDSIDRHCPPEGLCVLTVSKEARTWLKGMFATAADLKSFGKFDRRFRLEWVERRNETETELVLQRIDEIAEEVKPKESGPSDRLFIHAASPVGFDDIAGQQRVKKQLQSLISLLRNEAGLKQFGITLPKGLLLYGPEGVGKTMLVKAFAKEAKLPYLYLHGSDLFDEALIQAAYRRARLSAPMIIILEGVDVKGLVDGNYTQIPTEALCAMIDISPDEPENFLFTVLTAQEKEGVPAELMYAGRVDQFVAVPELDRDARRFFAQKLLEKPHDKIDTERITRYMSGMNGYELGRIAKASALEALKAGKTRLDERMVIDQINTIKYGSRLDKKRLKNFEEDLRRSAYHEAAHAVTSLVLLPEVEIEQVTVIPRSEALGLVSYTQENIQTNMSYEEIRGNIAVCLAGRLATVKAFGKTKGMETGAYSDLQQATLYAFSAVAQYGMDETLENLNIELLLQNVSNTLYAEKIEVRIASWISEGTETARSIVDAQWELIESVAERLIREEFIEGSELKSLFTARGNKDKRDG